MTDQAEHPAATWVAPLLEGWANQIAARFHAPVYLVGSALAQAQPRDIDIRVVLTEEAFLKRYGCTWIDAETIGPWSHVDRPIEVARYWTDVAKLGKWAAEHHGGGMLNIDFQVQTDNANNARSHGNKPRIRLDKLGDFDAVVSCPSCGHAV